MATSRFINDIIKPWDELSVLLSKPLALQPNLSDVTRLAGGLAVSIRHQAERAEVNQSIANDECVEHRIISDTADFWKHGPLRDPSRNNDFSAEAFFEYDARRGFSFIRNALFVEHTTLGKHDFLQTTRSAIFYWMKKRVIQADWKGKIQQNPEEFHDVAILYFGMGRNIELSQVRLGFFSKTEGSRLERVNPPEVRFAVLEKLQPQ